MLKNLVKIAIRSLLKDKAYSAINILGLTIGITCSLFLLLYIMDELSYDRYHVNAKNIYRVVSDIKEPDNAFTWAVAQRPLGPELRDTYPEIKYAVRFDGTGRTLYKNGDKQFYENNFYLTDSAVFEMFTYEFLAGDSKTAMYAPFSMVITEKIAKKYFGNAADALNQTLTNQQNEVFKITGVIKDVPLNSHFLFDALISPATRPKFIGGWGGFGTSTYIQLTPNYDEAKMQAAFDKIVKEKVNPIFEQLGISVRYVLQPMVDIHLYSKIQDDTSGGGDISNVYIFAAVAIFMIVIACINYMNLATARSSSRAKEVGLRKVMGSGRGPLVAQFLTESLVVTFVALALSLALIYFTLPTFNTLAGKQLPFAHVLQAPVLLSLLGIVFVTGVLGGSYPAFYLSAFNPLSVLKGKLASRGGSSLLRRGLVVVQFGLSITMLICTLIVFDQLKFLRNKDLGFNKANVIRMNLNNRELQSKAAEFAEALKRLPSVVSVGRATSAPGDNIGKGLFKVEDAEGKMVDRGVDLFAADYDFIDALGMKVVQGRNFSKDNPADTNFAVLVNESMVSRMGWKDPIGKRFVIDDGNNFNRQVIGVVKDYNQSSLYSPIEPLMIYLNVRNNFMFARIVPGNVQESVAAVESEWKKMFPSQPFEFNFLDADLDSQYQADQKRSQIFTAFSGLTILIACLGLLGLAAYTTERRTKEIGVRKVIGASVNNLVVLVSKEFILLVSIGTLIAFPVSWYVTSRWLENFAFRIDLVNEWGTFLLSALLAIVITMCTVGFHVVRAALANPVHALRDE